MDNDETGAYIRLICFCWTDGSISADLAAVARLLPRTSAKEMARLWKAIGPCFQPHPTEPGRLIQKRVEKERAKKNDYHDSQKRKSELGVAARKKKSLEPAGPSLGLSVDSPESKPVGQPGDQPLGVPDDDPEGLPAGRPGDNPNPGLTSPVTPVTASANTPPSPPLADTGGEDRSQKSPAFALGIWFFETGAPLGALEHFKIQGANEFAYRHLEASKALVETYPLAEIQRRSMALFARKAEGAENRIRKPANPTFLRDQWAMFEGPPGRPEGSEDYDKHLGLNHDHDHAAKPL